jgi:hypothetical protein
LSTTYYVRTDGNDSNDGLANSSDRAFASPGRAVSVATTTHDVIYVQSGLYVLTTATPGSGGPLLGAANTRLWIEGFGTTPGDLAARPIIDVGTQVNISVIKVDGAYPNMGIIKNIEVDGNNNTGIIGFDRGGQYGDDTYISCKATACSIGFNSASAALAVAEYCESISCPTGFSFINTVGCKTVSSSSIGFNMNYGNGPTATYDIAISGNIGFFCQGYTVVPCVNCVAYGCTSHGFDPTYALTPLINCIAVNCGGKGFDTISIYDRLINCAGYNNTGGNTGHSLVNHPFFALSGDPFTNASGGDFSLNNVVNAGAKIRGSGVSCFGSAGYVDIGFQHADPMASTLGLLAGNLRLNSVVSDVTGTLDLPSINDVQSGVIFDNVTQTGIFGWPVVGNVVDGVTYGANNIEYTGTFAVEVCDYPVVGNVRDDIVYGNNVYTGVLDIPSIARVEVGIVYDNYNSTGTLILPSIENVREGITFGSET